MSAPLTIVHRPTGIDHPYEPFFDERRPRDPSVGDMVVLGFLTTPGSIADSVRVDWTRNGVAEAPIFARALSRGDDEDRWLVELGVVEAGDVVTYQISAVDPRDGSPVAGTFGFSTRIWHTASFAEVTSGDAGTARVQIRDAGGARGPDLVIDAEPNGAETTFRFEPASNGARATGNLPSLIDERGRLHLPRANGEALVVTIRWQEESGRLCAIELTGGLGPDEMIAGFGERFDAVDQHGRAPDVNVYEQYKNQGNRTYLPIPFFLSSTGYGLLAGGTTTVRYDIGRSVPDRWRCSIDMPASGVQTLHAFRGKPESVVQALTARTGRPDPVPDWTYGLWISSNEWNTQERVEREVAELSRYDIPATVVVIEAWSDESTFYIWNGARYEASAGAEAPVAADFTYPDDGPWPDPSGMIDALHAQGLRLILWQIPVLKRLDERHAQHEHDIAHALERGLVLENEDGTPYRNPFFWFNGALIPDFTSDEATAWWMYKRRYLLDELGVDGFKTDGGEHLAGRGIRARSGMRGDELVNAFPQLYVEEYHRFARDRRGGDALTFSRAGHTGAGAVPAHWAGDENSTWSAYRRSIVAGLNAGLSGVIFWAWDIAGFSGDLPSTELYVRGAAMAAFCPIMQFHSEYNPSGPSRDRSPWNVAERNGDLRALILFRFFTRVRERIQPYLIEEGRFSAANGTPLMRALLLDFPDDEACWRIADQYMLGRSLLVAPIVEERATSRVLYLPAGEWRDLWSGERHSGPAWVTVEAPWERIPVFRREEGSALLDDLRLDEITPG